MKKPAKQQEKKAVREYRKRMIILTVLVLVVTAIIMGIWLYRRSNPGAEVSEYNTYATVQAYSRAQIGAQDILILHTIKRNPGGDSVAEFYIYRLPEGANGLSYMDNTTADIGKKLEQIGTATCTFISDNPAAVHDLKTIFTR